MTSRIAPFRLAQISWLIPAERRPEVGPGHFSAPAELVRDGRERPTAATVPYRRRTLSSSTTWRVRSIRASFIVLAQVRRMDAAFALSARIGAPARSPVLCQMIWPIQRICRDNDDRHFWCQVKNAPFFGPIPIDHLHRNAG